jgi:hypothetical protein
MNRKRLESLVRKIAACRQTQPKVKELISIAQALGRRKEKRGKEPTWVSPFPELLPLSIPDHEGRDIPRGTKNSILNQLENDIMSWDAFLTLNEASNGSGTH